eukprot:1232736-Prorocentrum_lima.AAC.1
MGHPSYLGLPLLHSRAGAGGNGCSEGQVEQGGKRSRIAGPARQLHTVEWVRPLGKKARCLGCDGVRDVDRNAAG